MGLDSAAAIAEWGFLGVNFYWHHTVQQEFIAPEDTRIYVGRRIAFGSSIRCSECFRPFSRTRPRETCADCRDECCNECGRDLHMSELGSRVDMMCFFCSKCHRLLIAEMNAGRNKDLLSPRPVSARSPGASKAEACRNFRSGECTYGDACKFQHASSGESPRSRSGSNRRAQENVVSRPSTPAMSTSFSRIPGDLEPRPHSDTSPDTQDSSGGPVERKKPRARGKRGKRKKRLGMTSASDTDGTGADVEEDSLDGDDNGDVQRDCL